MRPQLEVEGVTHRTVALGALDVHVAEAGNGPPLVLVHGWPQHWYAWRLLVPRLADRYRLIMPDLRGFGWSSAPRRGYAKEQLATDLLGLLDALGLDRVDLVGHDWGAWTGFLACLRAPHRFGRYTALNIAPPWPQPTPDNLRGLGSFAYQLVLAAPRIGRLSLQRTDFAKKVIRSAAHQWMDEDAIEAYAASLREPARARASVRLYRRFLLTEIGPVVAGRYAHLRLKVPTRVLLGAHDPAIRPALMAGAEDHCDDLQVFVHDGAGHFLAEEQPDWVAEHVLANAGG